MKTLSWNKNEWVFFSVPAVPSGAIGTPPVPPPVLPHLHLLYRYSYIQYPAVLSVTTCFCNHHPHSHCLLGSLLGPALLQPNLSPPPLQPLRGKADLHLCLSLPTLWCSISCLACQRLLSRPSLRGLWRNLLPYDQQHVVFSAHYWDRLTPGRVPPWCGEPEALCPGFLCFPCPKGQEARTASSSAFGSWASTC